MRKIYYFILSLMLIVGVMGLTGTKAQALEKNASKVSTWGEDGAYAPYMSLDDTLLLNDVLFSGSAIGGLPTDNYRITKVTSSNKNVAEYAADVSDEKSFFLKTVGTGKTKITVRLKYKGRTYKLSKVVEVVDDKPFKSIKYNKKEVYKGNEYTIHHVSGAKSGKKIEWKLKKGYKVISATFMGKNNKKINSGAKLNLKEVNYPEVYFFIQTPKNKYIYYYVDFYE